MGTGGTTLGYRGRDGFFARLFCGANGLSGTEYFFQGQEGIASGIPLDPADQILVGVRARFFWSLRKRPRPLPWIPASRFPFPSHEASLGDKRVERGRIIEEFSDTRRSQHQRVIASREVALF